jgi:prepilin-type N-terminal cleavage/methylation domain-containing protein
MSTHGFTLIEVLISFLIFSLIFVSADILQIKTIKEAKSNYYFAIANQQIHSMRERLITLKKKNIREDLLLWNKQNKEVLPEGLGNVSGIYPSYVIDILWGKREINTCDKIKIGESGCLRSVVNL